MGIIINEDFFGNEIDTITYTSKELNPKIDHNIDYDGIDDEIKDTIYISLEDDIFEEDL